MSLRKALFWTHLSVGSTLGLVILSMCVTGSMLAFEPQIVAFVERDVRFIPQPEPGTIRLRPESLLAKAQEAKPGVRPMMIMQRSNPAASVMVGFGRDGALFLNPYTGDVLGEISKIHKAFHEIEDFHRWFGDGNKKWGKPVTGTAALAFFALSLSGLILWWPRIMPVKEAVLYKKGLTGKARDWNWHTVTGFWLALFILIITSTGIIMSFTWANNLLYTFSGSPLPPAPPPTQTTQASPPAPLPVGEGSKGLDKLWSLAESQASGWKIISLKFPPMADAPLTFSIVESQAMLDSFRSQLTLDRRRGDVLKWEPYDQQNQGRLIRSWIIPMHTGRAWGVVGQFINLLVAFGGMMLIWTGFSMAWRRYRNWRRGAA